MSLRNLTGALLLGLCLAGCSAAVSSDATSESVGFDATAKSCCASQKAAKAAECSAEKKAACADKKTECSEAAKAACADKKTVDG